MLNRKLFVLAILLSAWLAACAPAATPTAAPYIEPPAMPTQAAMLPAATAAPAGQETGSDVQPVPPQADVNRMVIKNGDIEVLVTDVDAALMKVTQMTADLGGYVVNSQTGDQDGYRHASLQIAVPSAQFETALNRLHSLGVKVLHETASGQDVSAQYVDLQARLGNLEATAARVRDFLKDAKTVEESLRVNQQLSDLEGQIEQVKGQMKFYEGRAAFSTLTISLTPQIAPETPEPKAGWDPARTFQQASEVLANLAQHGADLLIWLGVLLSPVLIVGALGLVIFGLIRRASRNARA